MSTNKTQNYQLHAWALGDEVPMSEFNENFTKLDAALKAEQTARKNAVEGLLVTGIYMGDAVESRIISLGFTPKSILILPTNSKTHYNSSMYGGMAFPGYPAELNSVNDGIIVVTGGFQVNHRSSSSSGVYLNSKDMRYHYWALR